MNRDYLAAVHFQTMNDEGKLIKELVKSEKFFLASIVPGLLDSSIKTQEGEEIFGRIHPAFNFYPDWAKEGFRENKDNPQFFWIQEGYRHCCGRCFNQGRAIGKKSPDPHHEHVCLDGHAQSFEEQVEFIGEGKNLILKNLGIVPIGYCPANHLYNQDTLRAAKANGFELVLTRNGFGYIPLNWTEMPAYRDKDTGLIMLPEATRKGTSPVMMSYYHEDAQKVLDLVQLSSPLTKIRIEEFPASKIRENEQKILQAKRMRDKLNSIRDDFL